MKILKYLLFLLLISIIGFSLYVTTQPDHYEVKRERLISAPYTMIYDYVDDYQKWPLWSPWTEKDTLAQLSYSTPSSGANATYSWKGEEIGEGQMKTVYSANDSLFQEISFVKPYESKADVWWKFDRKKLGVMVTWGMKGSLSFMEKAYMIMQGKSMNELIGPDYELGLLNLDNALHDEMERYTIDFPGLTEYGGGYSLFQSSSCQIPDANKHIEKLLEEVGSYLEREGITAAGTPFAAIEKWDEQNNSALISAHFPVRDKITTPSGSTILSGYTAPGPYYKAILHGNYDNLRETYEKARFNMEKQDLAADNLKVPFQVMVKGPKDTDNPAEWVTEIYLPVLVPQS